MILSNLKTGGMKILVLRTPLPQKGKMNESLYVTEPCIESNDTRLKEK
jgi:hypothetical protein